MFNTTIEQYFQRVQERTGEVSEERKKLLEEIADSILQHMDDAQGVRLIFICTHNSRRSHFAHIWATVVAHKMGLSERIHAFSGGTEATAFHPNALVAAKRAGFEVEGSDAEAANPHYRLSFGAGLTPISCFSKIYDDPSNPQVDFIAIMTCSDADENCPFVSGAIARFKLAYEDPKIADGTPEEVGTYDERFLQIASEMWLLMEGVKQGMG